MSDGNNTDNVAQQLQERVATLESRLNDVVAEKAKLEGMHESDQAHIKRQAAEIGDLRKVEPVKTGKEEEEGEEQKQSVQTKTLPAETEDTLTSVKDSLTPGQFGKANDIFKSLPEEKRRELATDESKLKTFFKLAKEEVPAEAPDDLESLFKENKAAPSAGVEEIRQLFKSESTKNRRQPTGPVSGRGTKRTEVPVAKPRPVGGGDILANMQGARAV